MHFSKVETNCLKLEELLDQLMPDCCIPEIGFGRDEHYFIQIYSHNLGIFIKFVHFNAKLLLKMQLENFNVS